MLAHDPAHSGKEQEGQRTPGRERAKRVIAQIADHRIGIWHEGRGGHDHKSDGCDEKKQANGLARHLKGSERSSV